MGPLERHLEQLLVNFPNLVNSHLWGRKFRDSRGFGEVNVCVRQGKLPECSGRSDLAFITEHTIHIVELKRRIVGVTAREQLKRYLGPLQARYPDHLVLGYLLGRSCCDMPKLRAALVNERVSVLLVGQNIPRVGELRTCQICGAGFHYHHEICPYCAAD
jgi:hypothetical protein